MTGKSKAALASIESARSGGRARGRLPEYIPEPRLKGKKAK
jgi:hypothetical protein